MYVNRDLEKRLNLSIDQFPAVLITGPRQAGKSTLLQHCLHEYRYVSLDEPLMRQLALNDPELFLSTHPAPVIIDEIQYAPNLFPYLKIKIDADRHRFGQFVLTGSQTFQLMEGVSETLAGRIAIFHLYPFNWNEIEQIQGYETHSYDDLQMSKQLIQGFYPEFFNVAGLDWNLWYSSYISTYLERDVRNIKAISDLSRFQTFVSLLAARSGSILNISEVAKECGISQPTAKSWITILESTYVIYQLKPYHNNKTKRLVKSSKLYFIDTGLLCYLLGIDTQERFWRAAERGNLFENMVVIDCIKQCVNRSKKTSFYYYRTLSGSEIDLVIERGMKRYTFEIKLSKTIVPKMATQLKLLPSESANILCLRETPFPVTREINAIHWRDVFQYL